MRFHEDDSEQASQGLGEELRSALGRIPRVPSELDRRIVAAGVAHIAGGRRRMLLVLRWTGAVAAAALVAIALRFTVYEGRSPSVSAPAGGEALVASTGDLNRDGQVNILDAYLLARRVEAGQPELGIDVNRDGQVDLSDADALAMLAVELAGVAR